MAAKLPDKVRINVTRNDIAKGIPTKGTSCAVARAAHRLFPQYDIFVSAGGGLGLYEKGSMLRRGSYKLPERSINFIGDFDDHFPVKPTSFVATKVPHDD
jgi:hypothetical protein